jgi:hypothetical protein
VEHGYLANFGDSADMLFDEVGLVTVIAVSIPWMYKTLV